MMRLRFLFAALVFGFLSLQASPSLKQGAVIRDAEIEQILLLYLDQLFKAAGLNSADLKLYVLIDPEMNAFATTQSTIVAYSGFITKTESLDELVGVLAHETGHIAGHHLVRHSEAMHRVHQTSLLATAAGLLAALASGHGELAPALSMGLSDTAVRHFLSYSRGEEASADQAALKFLDKLCWPADGLARFFKKLSSQGLLSSNIQDPYYQTHPVTRERAASIEAQAPSLCRRGFPPEFEEKFQRLRVKMDSYLTPPAVILQKYPGEQELNLYARSIAYYRLSQFDAALSLLEKLRARSPRNPFYWELTGIVLFESGKVKKSIPCFEKSLSLYPSSSLLMIALAQSYISLNDPSLLGKARKLLKASLAKDPENTMAWYYLSIVCGRQRDMASMALALAERAYILADWETAYQQAQRAQQLSRKGTTQHQRILDLRDDIEQRKQEKKRDGN